MTIYAPGIRSKIFAGSIAAAFLIFAPFVPGRMYNALCQEGGNSISGMVYGIDRLPVNDLQVELLDEYARTIKRTRTSSGGFFQFMRIPSGRFIVHVLTYGTNYEEKDEDVEITNFSRPNMDGTTSTGGFDNKQVDVYLRLRKGAERGSNATVFAQEVPAAATTLYEKAIADLDSKKREAGLAGLKSALEIFPKYFSALERLGTEYVQVGQPSHYQAAEVLFTIAVEVNPRAYKSWYGLAFAQYSLNKFDAALLSVEKAIVLEPNVAEPYALSGVLLSQNNKFEEAEKRLIKARDLSKDTNPKVHFELARLYANHMKRYKDAARELKLFLKGQPDSKDAEKIHKLIANLEAKTDGQ